MWWNKEKSTMVELANSRSILGNTTQPDQRSDILPVAPESISPKLSTEAVFKSLALFAVALNGSLTVFGYMNLAGYLERFGITLSELDIDIPTLMFQGYLTLVNGVYGEANKYPLFGPAALCFVFVLIAGAIVFKLLPKHSPDKKFAISMFLGTLFLLSPTIPFLGAKYGMKLAAEDYSSQNGAWPKLGLQKTHTIKTNNGDISGAVLFSTKSYTIILVKNEVYKLSNDTNRIVRKITLSPREEPMEKFLLENQGTNSRTDHD
ncbi:hypothetical protein BK659_13760 [Pseudomonas brassicacearum]|uniref:Uncharacterized protein n=1 Tax=Pseudomonas brassicacearum TaxID=930166 RepID=A0A423H5W1_9PSED|nr:hypothetical protein [Pseudomonas brassicacearum]RON08459.1 hypothetical protein BK659_13760 [Pseudomonas brassicacearum]